MSALILLLLAVCLALLILEDWQVRRDRSELVHVVYVNGIRGKSTVTRMIDGGLRAVLIDAPKGRRGGQQVGDEPNSRYLAVCTGLPVI